jgi:hypothetical protein
MAQALEITDVIGPPTGLANVIANKFQEWTMFRTGWLDNTKEVREYIFATDTRSTTNSSLPWKNKTHIPKICQIRDNLHANYMAALFPNEYAIQWEGDNDEAEDKQTRLVIEQYMGNKLRKAKFRTEVSRLILDWIDYGNCFAMPVFVAEYKKDSVTGAELPIYVGPKLQRISPLDIVFDPTAPSFAEAPKIVRSLKNMGTFLSEIESKPELQYLEEGIQKARKARQRMAGYSEGDFSKNESFQIDGFTSWWDYFSSNLVEVLDFYGDIYDPETDTLKRNHLISVVDRSFIVRDHTDETWLGSPPIRHCGWRQRQDNLYSMGPLDNLIGMQYRIDHLENAKADAFDLIVHPVMKIKGFVEPFTYGPGAEIYTGDEGDVAFMAPDVTMLQADTQIMMYENKMEEMAGAPKQAMGFRTPGEKTAFEVQALENAANRIFLNKTSYFEEQFLEELINDMLELARRNFNESDTVRVLDEMGTVLFKQIKPEDLTAKGKLRPVGARHFAQNAQMVQNLTQLYSSAIGQDPAVMTHISGKKIAEVVEHLLQFEKFGLYGDNIRLTEQAETQKMADAAKQAAARQTQAMAPDDAAPVDPNAPPEQPVPSAMDQSLGISNRR